MKSWSLPRIESLLILLISENSSTILNFMRKIVEINLEPIDYSMNYLPDQILLKIFSKLDDKSLRICSLVCKRWYYLTNTQELWFYKCKILGNFHGIRRIENEIIKELFTDEDIDWKLAYHELKQYISHIKCHIFNKDHGNIDNQSEVRPKFQSRSTTSQSKNYGKFFSTIKIFFE